MEMDEETGKKILKWARLLACQFHQRNRDIDQEELEDVAVSAAVQAYPRWDPAQGKLNTFLPLLMRHAMIDHWRCWVHVRRRTQTCRKMLQFNSLGESLDGETPMEELLEGPSQDRTPQYEAREFLKQWRSQHLITRQSWMILMCRWGEGMTQEETGLILGLSPSRVSQLEAQLRRQYNLPDLRFASQAEGAVVVGR